MNEEFEREFLYWKSNRSYIFPGSGNNSGSNTQEMLKDFCRFTDYL